MADPRKSVFDDENITEAEVVDNTKNSTTSTEQQTIQQATQDTTTQDQAILEDNSNEGANYNPMAGDVKKREYANKVGLQDTVPIVDRVEEPTIINIPPPPPQNTSNPSASNNSSSTASTTTAPPKQEPLNPDMNGLSEKDSKRASSLLVDAVLSAYKQVWGLAYDYTKVTEAQIIEWVMNDEVSMSFRIVANDRGDETSLREIYDMYNSQSKEAMTVNLSDEGFVQVREAMIREFTKKGWGATDMQYIIQHFIRDAGQRAVAVYSLKSTINGFTKQVKEQHKAIKEERERVTNVKDNVEASEPTVIPRQERQEDAEAENTSKQRIYEAQSASNSNDMNEGSNDFVQTFEIVKSGISSEPNITEVPPYNGNPDFNSQK